MKEILKQIEVGLDPQDGLAQMDKDRNMKDRIWGQVMRLDPPMMQKTAEEIRGGDSEAA